MATRKPTPENVLDKLFVSGTGDVSRETNGMTRRIALGRIQDNPYQYRQHYDAATLCELATNIKSMSFQLPATSGLQQVPVGRVMVLAGDQLVQLEAGDYQRAFNLDKALREPGTLVEIAYGHRRLRAFIVLSMGPDAVDTTGKHAFAWPTPEPEEYGTLPVQLMYLDDQAMAEFALTENSQRDSVSAIEEAGLLQRMIDEFGLTLEDAGRRFGWDRTTVSNKLRLLRLPAKVRMWVMNGDLSEKHGRTLLRLDAVPDSMAEVAEKARKDSWSTRKLDEQITFAIRDLPVVPNGTVRVAGTYGEQVFRQPWDLAWQPVSKVVRGACEGCGMRVTFGNETAQRCGDKACYTEKKKLWASETERRQRDAAEKALTDLAGGTPTLVEIFGGEQRRRVQLLEKAHTWKSEEYVFNLSHDADQMLVEHQLCGPELCDCFAAVYEPQDSYPYDRKRWQPAPETAPDVVFCCTNAACAKAKLDGLRETVDKRRAEQRAAEEAQRREADPEYAKRVERSERDRAQSVRQEQENEEQAEALLAAAVNGAGGVEALWGNQAFLVEVVVAMGDSYRSDSVRANCVSSTVPELLQLIVNRVRANFHSNGRFDLDALHRLANRIAPPQPVATEPAATDELAAGWEWQKKGTQLRACIIVDGEEIKTRWHATAAEVIADAKYMNRELQLQQA